MRAALGILLENGLAVAIAWHQSNPVVRFTAQVDQSTLSVDASGTDNPTNATLEFRWTWGDGTTTEWTTTKTASHVYATPGTYNVKLEAREQNVGIVLSSVIQSINVASGTTVASIHVQLFDMSVGQTRRAVATLYAQDGTILTGRTSTWSASNGNVTITPLGDVADVYGVSEGVVTISATSDGVTGSRTVQILPTIDAATAQGNSFPYSMYQGQFYAVNLYMSNTGQNSTWSDHDGYGLRMVSPDLDEGWWPSGVGMEGSYTRPGQVHRFAFTLFNEAPFDQAYHVSYKMQHNGAVFGDINGRQINVLDPATCPPEKSCGLAIRAIPERLYPGGSVEDHALTERPKDVATGDTLQRLVIPNYPLSFEQQNGVDVAYIRYFGALDEPWDVDVTFRITAEPGTINFGLVRRALRLGNYDLSVSHEPRALLVRLSRRNAAAMLEAGESLLLEIPILAVRGRPLPRTLPQVELVVSR